MHFFASCFLLLLLGLPSAGGLVWQEPGTPPPNEEMNRKKPLSAPPGIPGEMMNRPNLPDKPDQALVDRIHAQPECFRIQRVALAYRDRKGLDPKNVRLCLLDLCPPDADRVSRPMTAIEVNGKLEMRVYDVVKKFSGKREAETFAKQHGLKVED